MDPADTFTLKLRGYQKQALLCVRVSAGRLLVSDQSFNSWMHSIETGAASAREAKSMHPLWKE